MATRMNWESANRAEKFKNSQPGSTSMFQGKKKAQHQTLMQDFATRHHLACFKCGSKTNKWGKTGINRRGPWAICLSCIKHDS